MVLTRKKNTAYHATLSFIIPFMTSVAFMLLTARLTDGYFYLFDDFAQQQVTFMNCMAGDISSGMTTYAHYAELGAGFLETYSYYGIGSPFFWLFYLLGIREFSHAILWMDALKIGFCGVTSFFYIRNYVSKTSSALIGSMLYALSTYQITNLCFQFADSLVFFPVLLLTLDRSITHKEYHWFSAAVAIACITNTVIFYSEAVFIIIYFILKVISKEYRITLKSFCCLALAVITGLLLSGVLFVPSVLATLSNPRSSIGFDSIISYFFLNGIQFTELIRSLILPVEFMTRRALLMDIYTVQADIYIPVFGVVYCFAYYFRHKKSFYTKMFLVCAVFALVPVLNSSFMGFTAEYYARWMYMPGLFMIIASMLTLEDDTISIKPGMITTGILGCILAAALLYLRLHYGERYIRGPMKLAYEVLLAAAAFVFCVVIRKKHDFRYFTAVIAAAIVVFTTVTGFVNTYYIKTGYMADGFRKEFYETDSLAPISNSGYYRIDTLNTYINQGYKLRVSSLNSFSSTIAPSVFDFYEHFGMPRTVRSNASNFNPCLRDLLSCKYIVIYPQYCWPVAEDTYLQQPPTNQTGDFYIYENSNYIPMGFRFRYAMFESEYSLIPEEMRDDVLLAALILPDDCDPSAYGLSVVDSSAAMALVNSISDEISYHRDTAAKDFTVTGKGFSSVVDSDTDGIVFFSIPYSESFSVTVNGEHVDPVICDFGFYGIPVESGVQDIEFTFSQPGLTAGIIMTASGCLAFAGLFIIDRRRQNKSTVDGI